MYCNLQNSWLKNAADKVRTNIGQTADKVRTEGGQNTDVFGSQNLIRRSLIHGVSHFIAYCNQIGLCCHIAHGFKTMPLSGVLQ